MMKGPYITLECKGCIVYSVKDEQGAVVVAVRGGG